MQKYSDVVIGLSGSPLSGVTVTVKLAGTSTLATLYSDNGVTPKANPFVNEADGSFKFYAPRGRYDLTFQKAGYVFDPTDTSDVRLSDGISKTLPTNFISGAGVEGVDDTAQVVQSIVVPANTLREVGDRLRVHTFWRGDGGASVTGSLTLNGVLVAETTGSGQSTPHISEAWLSYVDPTHANLISYEDGVAVEALTQENVAGFDWANEQTLALAQSQSGNNHIKLFSLVGDVYPKE